jgi:prevent-host-death family protein
MSVVTIQRDQSRLQWREAIDAAYADKKDVVIEQSGTPIVALVNYAKWDAMVKRLKALEFAKRTRERYEEMKTDPTKLITEEQYHALLQQEGLSV